MYYVASVHKALENTRRTQIQLFLHFQSVDDFTNWRVANCCLLLLFVKCVPLIFQQVKKETEDWPGNKVQKEKLDLEDVRGL